MESHHQGPSHHGDCDFTGECLAGALHWEDLYRVVQQVGFSQPRLVGAKMVDVSKFKDILGQSVPLFLEGGGGGMEEGVTIVFEASFILCSRFGWFI